MCAQLPRWELDRCDCTGETRMPCNVIVVSQHEDISLYLRAMESGAYDFATLQTSSRDLCWLLRSTIENAESRRKAKKTEGISFCGKEPVAECGASS